MKKFTLSSFLFLLCILAIAQDKIYKKDQSIIEGKITEIGLNAIKYTEPDLTDGPIISISIDDLLKVELSNGRVIEFKDPLNDPASYSEDRKSAVKVHFLSPLLEHLSFSYERSIKPGRSFETDISLIGIGFDTEVNSKSTGLGIGAGIKFMRTPDFYQERLKYAHILKGAYVKPQILLSVYNNKYYDFSFGTFLLEEHEQNIVAGALILNIGKQIVYDNFFVIDYSFGVGYGFSSEKNDYDQDGYERYSRVNHFGYIIADSSSPIAISAKLKIGILLN